MMRRCICVCILVALLAMLATSRYAVADGGNSGRVKRLVNMPLSGSEELPVVPGARRSVAPAVSRVEPYTSIQIGDTKYDYQQNCSMGRQVAFTFEGTSGFCGVHFAWTCLPCDGCTPPTYRHIRYNAVGCNGVWAWSYGPCGGDAMDYSNGGYVSVDATHSGTAVLALHHGLIPEMYGAWAYVDANPPLGFFAGGLNPGPSESVPPPNCQEIISGNYEETSQYLWPKCEFDMCGSSEIIHKVATESPPFSAPTDEIQTLVYYKDIWDPVYYSVYPPSCGTVIDSVYSISAVVRQDPTSDEVAIIWGHPIYPDGDPDDPCGLLQWQNDVFVWKSYDCGETWNPMDKLNVTDYTQGGSIPIDEVRQLFYCDLSAVYDHDGVLHVVWSTPLRDGDADGCQPLDASRIWHWDDLNDWISLVYDASMPGNMEDQGSWSSAACKVNISECYADGEKRMYCTFTRFGAHTDGVGSTSIDGSAGGFENGEIFITGSSDGGLTWGPDPDAPAYGGCVADGPPCKEAPSAAGTAINLTNTCSPNCAAGFCFSEHWASMAKYSFDSVYIEYILDKDAGDYPYGNGDITCNPVMYATYPCFPIDAVCQLTYAPSEIGYPTIIAPDGEPGCLSPYTTTFDLVIENVGNVPADYAVVSNAGWLTYAGGDPMSGTIPPGGVDPAIITMQIGPIPPPEGVYCTTLDIVGCGGDFQASMDVCVYVYCYASPPEYDILSTSCWSVGVWNSARAGIAERGDDGNMYWFSPYYFPMMYDESIVITYADDVSQTWFSVFDGSDDDVSLIPTGYLTSTSSGTYEYAHGSWVTSDMKIAGEIEYYLPTHPDTCVLVERMVICNDHDAAMSLHIGEAIDWDIPEADGGTDNDCSKSDGRQEIYQFGVPAGSPEADYYGGVSFVCDIPGAIVLDNPTWVDPNSGFVPSEIGGLLATHTGFDADCSAGPLDYSSVYVIAQDVALTPGECVTYCKVKSSSIDGLADLQNLLDKGKSWIEQNGIDCPVCEVDLCPDHEAEVKTEGGTLSGVEVRSRFRIYQNEFDPSALGLNFIVWQKESWVSINGWSITVCGFGDAVSYRIDEHNVGVHAFGGDVALNQYVEVDATLYLTGWNTARLKDADWNRGYREGDSGAKDIAKACPDFGWVVENPRVTKNGAIEHTIVIENDDQEESFILTGLAFTYMDSVVGNIAEIEDYTDSLEDITLDTGGTMIDTLVEVPCTVGDANRDGGIDIDDVVHVIAYIFLGGPAPVPIEAGDADCSGEVDIDDAVHLINYIFFAGPPPGQTCICVGYRAGGRGAGHVYGTFTIESDRGDVEAVIWIDHPTDTE